MPVQRGRTCFPLDARYEKARRVGDSIGEQNTWRSYWKMLILFVARRAVSIALDVYEQNTWCSYWKMRISIVARRAVSMALDARYKKALVFSSSTSSASFVPSPSSEAGRAHIISVPPLGASGATILSAGSTSFVWLSLRVSKVI
jgi:hypothetical protein